jgi:hypothetical protein
MTTWSEEKREQIKKNCQNTSKIKLDFSECQISWLRASVPFHPKVYYSNKTKLHQLLEYDTVCAKIAKSYSAPHVHVKDAIYSIHDPDEAAAMTRQLHLTTQQRAKVAAILCKCGIMFSGCIGC